MSVVEWGELGKLGEAQTLQVIPTGLCWGMLWGTLTARGRGRDFASLGEAGWQSVRNLVTREYCRLPSIDHDDEYADSIAAAQ